MESGSSAGSAGRLAEIPADDVHVECRRQIAQLKQGIGELEGRLNQNSQNSSRAPSSDWARVAARSQRPVRGRRPGGQAGHPGFTLQKAERPDRIVQHQMLCCGNCGRWLVEQKPTGVAKRQVFDIPAGKVEVTEQQAEIKVCGHWGHKNTAEFP